MPKETFWPATAVENDGSEPTVTVTWHGELPEVLVNGVAFDYSALKRMIRVLNKACDSTYGADE